jgi:predicted nucleotidyltransferase
VLLGEILRRRRAETANRVEQLRRELQEAEKLLANKACVYVTGSFGRGEAGTFSDLDLFIAGKNAGDDRALRPLDEILVKAKLIEAVRNLGIQDFSGDGEYLNHYSVTELVRTLGTPEDDITNTFTARLLLLLESRPLLESTVYQKVIHPVVDAYWRDYEGRENEFVPAFLANDILRLWRTFCVNYEARTSTEPPPKKAKRKLKNFKLKHSRLLTCYSALLYLLFVYSKRKTVSPTDAIDMIRLTPTERLEWLHGETHLNRIEDLIKCYEAFLEETNYAEAELINRFLDPDKSREYFKAANQLGDLVFEILENIGQKTRFHRLLVV